MPPKGVKVVAGNRRARHEYVILDVLEAGMVLRGSEVKSLREGKVQLADAYARVEGGELWLYGVHVSPYGFASGFGIVDPDRRRKLLAHRDEIDRWGSKAARERLTIVPLAIYFVKGRAKVELGLARGKKHHDRRQDIATRDAAREAQRAMARGRRGEP